MKISYNWLRNYIKTDLTPEEIAKILTYIGLEVEEVKPISTVPGGFEGLVVGSVLRCDQHPNADRLKVTQVDIGRGEAVQIVCGAPNVAAGQKVVVAPVGTTLHSTSGETFTIKKSKLRGEPSEGMICAEDEIGLGDSHDGIIVLEDDAKVGTPLTTLFPEKCDYCFEIGLTANRADAMSHYGVARDLAAYLNQTKPTHAELPPHTIAEKEMSDSQIELGEIDVKGCIRYSGLTIKGVKVSESPEWLKNSLRSIGHNPINNIVDITNFVLHELGQPLHAFDFASFPTRKVDVRFSKRGTAFTSLDGKERELQDDDLMICHGATPLCLAGILGGIDSGVTEKTTDIFLESAVFDPIVIRKSARRHALNTDASFRFERGIDPAFTLIALKRAASLILEIAGGEIDGKIIDFYPTPLVHAPFEFDSKRAQMIMGIELTRMELETLFQSLEIEYRPIGAGKYELTVPYYRVDVTRAEDVVEDLLRLYGYDRVPVPDQMTIALPSSQAGKQTLRHDAISNRLVGAGFYEIMCNSLGAKMHYETIEAFSNDSLVEVMNPLSSELNILRPSLLLGGLDTISRNISHQRPNLRLFEFGHVYTKKVGEAKKGKPLSPYDETDHLALFICGNQQEDTWSLEPSPSTVYDLKAHIEAILQEAGIQLESCTFVDAPEGLFENGSSIKYKKKTLAHFGTVSQNLLGIFGIKTPVYAAEINWEVLLKEWDKKTTLFDELPKFPEVRRDLALLIDKEVTYKEIEKIARKQTGKLLKRMGLFDVYEGEKIPDGKKSYAVMFILQDNERTLDDKTIDGCMRNLTHAFEKEIGASLR